LAPAVKKLLFLTVPPASGIGEIAGSENPCTASPSYDTIEMAGTLFTVGSYAELAVKASITASYSAGRGPRGHEPAVIRISASYHITVGEGGGGE
jgi:hypothetical protein